MQTKVKLCVFASLLFFQVYLCAYVCSPATSVFVPGGWEFPVTNVSDAGQAGRSQVDIDAVGNAIAVWEFGDDGSRVIQTSRYNALTAVWSAVKDLTSLNDASEPQVAMDEAGNAIAVWVLDDGTNRNIQTSRYTDMWSAVETLSTATVAGESAIQPQVAMDEAGNAIVVWEFYDGSKRDIQASRYNVTTGMWSDEVETLSTAGAGEYAYGPQVAMDEAGNAISVWMFDDGSNESIQTSRYNVTTGVWSEVETLSTADPGIDAAEPQVAMNAAGDAVAVWKLNNGDKGKVQTKRYSILTDSWSATEIVLATSGDDPGVAMDFAGNAIAVWELEYGDGGEVVQAKRYSVKTGLWSVSATNLSNFGVNTYDPQVAMDKIGNAIAVWEFDDGSSRLIQAKRYTVVADSWSVVPTVLAYSGRDPQIAMNAAGDAVAVWTCNVDGDKVIQSALYSIKKKLTAIKKMCRFPTQTDIVNVLYWGPVGTAVKYRIYTDSDLKNILNNDMLTAGVLIAEVPASKKPFFEHHGRCPEKKVTYHVVPVDIFGQALDSFSITV